MTTKTKQRKRPETEARTIPVQTRTVIADMRVRAAEGDQGDRTVDLTFSSEFPVDRWFGTEVLDHSNRKSVRMDRLASGAANLLFNHDRDIILGVIESAEIDVKAKVGRATVRFGNGERASEALRDVRDGILTSVSVSYSIHSARETAYDDDEGRSTYTVDDWEPLEISLVSIPADPSVGVGRAFDDVKTKAIFKREVSNMDPEDDDKGVKIIHKPADPAEVEKLAREKLEKRLKEMRSIMEIGQKFELQEAAQRFCDEGKTPEEFNRYVLENVDRAKPEDLDPKKVEEPIGLTDKEVRVYSILKLIRAAGNPNNKALQEDAAFELECHFAAADKREDAPKGVLIPMDILQRAAFRKLSIAQRTAIATQRDLSVGSGAAGGYLVSTDLMPGSFIDVLRNRTRVLGAGATLMTDLTGNPAIPRKTAGSTAGWIATEGGDAAQSEPTFDQVTLTPKTLGNFMEYTRNLLLQSSLSIEALVRDDLIMGMALAIDYAAHYGSGASGQPEGILNTTGIGSLDFAAADPTFLEIIGLETQVAADNADIGAMRYFCDATMRGALKGTKKDAGSGEFVFTGNEMNGYPVEVTNQIIDGDVFFGNYADLLIGMWGGLDILVDPFSNSKSGTIRVVAHQSMDTAVRHPESFAIGNDDQ